MLRSGRLIIGMNSELSFVHKLIVAAPLLRDCLLGHGSTVYPVCLLPFAATCGTRPMRRSAGRLADLVADSIAFPSYEIALPFRDLVLELELFLHAANMLSVARCNCSARTISCSLLLGRTCCASEITTLLILVFELLGLPLGCLVRSSASSSSSLLPSFSSTSSGGLYPGFTLISFRTEPSARVDDGMTDSPVASWRMPELAVFADLGGIVSGAKGGEWPRLSPGNECVPI
ncbi:hypothetical protein KC345_g300 [Hortaea werneckii]|nr:hypothetical protein KC345_g300 [Hortaea werneckii]